MTDPTPDTRRSPLEHERDDWRELSQDVQPLLAEGYTAIMASRPGVWLVKGPGPTGNATNNLRDTLLSDYAAMQAEIDALKAERDRLREASEIAATIANGALDPTAREATLRRDLSRVRDTLRAALASTQEDGK